MIRAFDGACEGGAGCRGPHPGEAKRRAILAGLRNVDARWSCFCEIFVFPSSLSLHAIFHSDGDEPEKRPWSDAEIRRYTGRLTVDQFLMVLGTVHGMVTQIADVKVG